MTDRNASTLRVLSWNVRSLRDDVAAVTRVIRGCEADVVCVQEAPRFLRWRSKCGALAADSGLVVITGGRPAGAMLLMARAGLPLLHTRDVLLSKAPRLHQRGLAMAVFRVGQHPVAVASMHLDLDPAERIRHVEEILSHIRGLGAPVVLAGDVNETSDGPAFRALASVLPEASAGLDSPTAGFDSVPRRIDAVFADPRFKLLSAQVLVGPDVEAASDHRPIRVELAVQAEVSRA